jgi:hypothetical protein
MAGRHRQPSYLSATGIFLMATRFSSSRALPKKFSAEQPSPRLRLAKDSGRYNRQSIDEESAHSFKYLVEFLGSYFSN